MRIALLISIPAALVLAAAPTTASAAEKMAWAVSCTRVSSTQVHAMLGAPARTPQVQKNGPVSVCSYGAVIVRVQTGVSMKVFQSGRKQFGAHGEPTKTVHDLGTDAYSSVTGSGTHAMSTVVTLSGRTELLVAAPASLPRVESFVKKVLPSL